MKGNLKNMNNTCLNPEISSVMVFTEDYIGIKALTFLERTSSDLCDWDDCANGLCVYKRTVEKGYGIGFLIYIEKDSISWNLLNSNYPNLALCVQVTIQNNCTVARIDFVRGILKHSFFTKMMTISTGMIDFLTKTKIDDQIEKSQYFSKILTFSPKKFADCHSSKPFSFGYFLEYPQLNDISEKEFSEIPSCLRFLIILAEKKRCSFICLDQDGPMVLLQSQGGN